MPHAPARRSAVFSWALYDFADTIFSMNVVSRFLPLWLTAGLAAPGWAFPLTLSLSMAMVALMAPGLGAASDTLRRRKPFLLAAALACAACTFFLGWGSLVPTLALFLAAQFFYQLAFVFYSAMLPQVSRGREASEVSGLGTALGYLGSIAGIMLAWPYVSTMAMAKVPAFLQSLVGATSLAPVTAETEGAASYLNVFMPTAVLYLLFALPCLLFVREEKAAAERGEVWKNVRSAPGRLMATLRDMRKHPAAARFMIANFFLLDAAHTVIAFMAVYASEAIGMKSDAMNAFFIVSTVFAMLGSFAYGRYAARYSARRGMGLCFVNWAAAAALALASPSPLVFWLVGPLAGTALGGLWTCARVCLVELAPPERVGEYFGVYALTGKCAAILGPLLWGATVFALEPLGALRYRAVLVWLLGFVLLGWTIYKKIPEDSFRISREV